MKPVIFFLRGFNSYDSEDLRFGPLNFGRAEQHLRPAIEKHGFNLIALDNMGKGPIEKQAEEATEQIRNLYAREHFGAPLHLLGHSAGGVVARVLAHHIQKLNLPLKTVISISSPHRGALLSDLATDLKTRHPIFHKSIKWLGHDLETRQPLYDIWKKKNIEKVNALYPNLSSVAYASIVSGTSLKNLPALLRLMNAPVKNPNFITDGIVEASSQPWGRVLMELDLDHGAILGFKTYLSRHKHIQNRQKFSKMIQIISDFLLRSS